MHTAGDPSTWDQMCGNLCFRFGVFTTPGWGPSLSGPTIWDVGLRSNPKNTNAAAAPAGAVHWWRNRTSTGKPGHGGVGVTPGGDNVFMATFAVREPMGIPGVNTALGLQSVGGYSAAKTFMEYMGWSDNYAGARYAGAVPTGGGVTPISQDVAARYIWAPGRAGLLLKVGGIYYPTSLEEAANLALVFNGVNVSDRQWDVQRQACLNMAADEAVPMRALQAGIDASFAEITARFDAWDDDLTPDVDIGALAAALAPALAREGVSVEIDAEALAEVFLDASATRLGM